MYERDQRELMVGAESIRQRKPHELKYPGTCRLRPVLMCSFSNLENVTETHQEAGLRTTRQVTAIRNQRQRPALGHAEGRYGLEHPSKNNLDINSNLREADWERDLLYRAVDRHPGIVQPKADMRLLRHVSPPSQSCELLRKKLTTPNQGARPKFDNINTGHKTHSYSGSE